MKTYDFVVLGGGSAGFNGARVARSLGKRVAIIDGARKLGGLCILRGCMPSKTLLWSTEVLHLAQKADRFGLRIPIAEVDMRALHRRKLRVIGEFADYREQAMESGKYDLYRSNARFVSPNRVELTDGTRIEGRHFLIATGSRVSEPPIPGLADTPYWTSDEALELDRVPLSVIVLGGGIVACELAQFLRRIGAKVIQIQRSPHILRDYSCDAADVVQAAFRDEGIELFTHTQIRKVSGDRSGVSVEFEDLSTGRIVRRRAAHLLNALGREPAVRSLELEAAGVRTAASGRIVTNRWQQTSQPHIYAGGDVCGTMEVVHLAVQQGELAARHAFGVKKIKPVDYDLAMTVVFTDPPVASIGLGEQELVRRKVPFLKASYPFNDHGKSILMDANYGYVRVLADPRKGRILGAEIVGAQAGEMIHCFSVAMSMKATVRDMLRAPWYHPTLSEILTYPLEEIADQLP